LKHPNNKQSSSASSHPNTPTPPNYNPMEGSQDEGLWEGLVSSLKDKKAREPILENLRNIGLFVGSIFFLRSLFPLLVEAITNGEDLSVSALQPQQQVPPLL